MTSTRVTRRIDSDEPASTSVVEAVASAKGIDPIDLDACLYDYIDPSALDTLIGGGDRPDSDLCISFTMADCYVTLDQTGLITVTAAGGTEPGKAEVPS
jgi:hypothetical protein